MSRNLPSLLSGSFFALGLAALAGAQCSQTMLPSYGTGSVTFSVLGPSGLFTVLGDWHGKVVIGGGLDGVGGVQANRVAAWNGSSWEALPGNGTNGVNGAVHTLGVFPNGDLLLGGNFSMAGGQPSSGLARYNGTNWGTGFTFTGQVECHCFLPNGDLIVGGAFPTTAGIAVSRVARYDGQSWHPLGAGLDDIVYALLTLPNGDVVAGGTFTEGVAIWDGSTWSGIAPNTNGSVNALHRRANGDLVAGGTFTTIGGVAASRIARWDGSAWSPIGGNGPTNGGVRSLVDLPGGSLCAVGGFSQIDGVAAVGAARWDGASWQSLGTSFFGGTPNTGTMSNDGELVLVGRWSNAGTTNSPNMIRVASTCPAGTAALGAGCPSAGGGNTVTSNAPWIGGDWTVTGTGLPTTALVAIVNGFTTMSLPLPLLLPQGQPGCTLLVQPDAVGIELTTTGEVTVTVAVPNAVSLAGQVLDHQMLPFELDASLAIVAVTATNALAVTIGAF